MLSKNKLISLSFSKIVKLIKLLSTILSVKLLILFIKNVVVVLFQAILDKERVEQAFAALDVNAITETLFHCFV